MSAPRDQIVTQACADDARLASLRRYDVLDSPPEGAFDDLTHLAAHLCDAPIALISLVDADRQWFKSEVGLGGVCETPLDVSICAHALPGRDLFVVPDTLLDDRFRHNPLVTAGPQIRFYAGAVLIAPDGHALGTLCVLDRRPRTLAPEQAAALRALGRQVVTQLELRRALALQSRIMAERERLEQTLREAKESAEAANRAKDRFFAVLSHELRTPLSPALMITAALASDGSLPAHAREDLRVVHRNIELETHLIDSMLDLTRIASGKLQLHVEDLDLRPLLRDAVAMVRGEAAAKSVGITMDLRAATHAVRGDAPKLVQVFGNLLRNAVKFTPPGGLVKVRTTETIAAGQATPAVRVDVADSGVGIAPAVLPRVFDAFEQGDRATTRDYGGLGLGLAISKGIVEAHGGRISAASDGPGRGATFAVELTAAAAAAKAPPVPIAPPAAVPVAQACAPLKILLVEDHEDTRRAMSRLLTRLTHSVTTAASVQDALAAASQDEFDLVISDLGLPDGTGLDLLAALAERRPYKAIALTGYGMESDIQSTRQAGFAAHLTKPVHAHELRAAISRVTRI